MYSNIYFPELIYLNDYGGNYSLYEEALLEIYERDLWKGNLKFDGIKVVPRVHKKFQLNGKTLDWTFVHFTSKGSIEEDRELDLRRCERIGYVKIIIENAETEYVKVWENFRFDKNNKQIKSVVLWCEMVNSKVVITRKKGKESEYYAITTFYLVNNPKSIFSLNKEYEEYVEKNGKFVFTSK